MLARNFKAAKSIIEERDKALNEGQELQEQLRLIESDKKTLNLSIEELNNKISHAKESISSTEADLGKKPSNILSRVNFINILLIDAILNSRCQRSNTFLPRSKHRVQTFDWLSAQNSP